MITISEAVKEHIHRTPYIEDLMAQGIINTTAYARLIRPAIEAICMKEMSDEAVNMAIRRLPTEMKAMKLGSIFQTKPDILLRSGLVEITVANSASLREKKLELLENLTSAPETFFTVTQGLFESTIIASRSLEPQILSILDGEVVENHVRDLSAVTIRLTRETLETPGVYYHILKACALAGINLVEVVSTYLELTLIVADNQADQTLRELRLLFS